MAVNAESIATQSAECSRVWRLPGFCQAGHSAVAGTVRHQCRTLEMCTTIVGITLFKGIKAYATASVSRAGEEVDRFIIVTSGSI
jgi:hypothetical protein